MNETKADPCFLGLSRDGVWLHVSSFSGDGVSGGAASFLVDDMDALHAELVAKHVAIELEPMDQTWGTIVISDGRHSYEFDYTLAQAP